MMSDKLVRYIANSLYGDRSWAEHTAEAMATLLEVLLDEVSVKDLEAMVCRHALGRSRHVH